MMTAFTQPYTSLIDRLAFDVVRIGSQKSTPDTCQQSTSCEKTQSSHWAPEITIAKRHCFLSCLVNVDKLIVLRIRQILERVLAQHNTATLDVVTVVRGAGVLVLHAEIADLGGLAGLDALGRLHLVEQEDVGGLETDDGEKGASDTHGLGQTGLVGRGIVGAEEERTDDVASGGADVLE